jgi:hypothetical protein
MVRDDAGIPCRHDACAVNNFKWFSPFCDHLTFVSLIPFLNAYYAGKKQQL